MRLQQGAAAQEIMPRKLSDLLDAAPQLLAFAAWKLGSPGAAAHPTAALRKLQDILSGAWAKLPDWSAQDRQRIAQHQPLQTALLQLTAVVVHTPAVEAWEAAARGGNSLLALMTSLQVR
jgi:hypothetical protein